MWILSEVYLLRNLCHSSFAEKILQKESKISAFFNFHGIKLEILNGQNDSTYSLCSFNWSDYKYVVFISYISPNPTTVTSPRYDVAHRPGLQFDSGATRCHGVEHYRPGSVAMRYR